MAPENNSQTQPPTMIHIASKRMKWIPEKEIDTFYTVIPSHKWVQAVYREIVLLQPQFPITNPFPYLCWQKRADNNYAILRVSSLIE